MSDEAEDSGIIEAAVAMGVATYVLVTDVDTYPLKSNPYKNCRLKKNGRPDRRTTLGKAVSNWEFIQLKIARACAETGRDFEPAEFTNSIDDVMYGVVTPVETPFMALARKS